MLTDFRRVRARSKRYADEKRRPRASLADDALPDRLARCVTPGEVYAVAGREFNLNSPMQLRQVLFGIRCDPITDHTCTQRSILRNQLDKGSP